MKLRPGEVIESFHVIDTDPEFRTNYIIVAFTNDGRLLERRKGITGGMIWTDITPDTEKSSDAS